MENLKDLRKAAARELYRVKRMDPETREAMNAYSRRYYQKRRAENPEKFQRYRLTAYKNALIKAGYTVIPPEGGEE